MARLGLAVSKLHLLSVAVVRCDEQDIAFLLAALVDLGDGLVTGLDSRESSLILYTIKLADPTIEHVETQDNFTYHTSVSDHVRSSKILHHKSALVNTNHAKPC